MGVKQHNNIKIVKAKVNKSQPISIKSSFVNSYFKLPENIKLIAPGVFNLTTCFQGKMSFLTDKKLEKAVQKWKKLLPAPNGGWSEFDLFNFIENLNSLYKENPEKMSAQEPFLISQQILTQHFIKKGFLFNSGENIEFTPTFNTLRRITDGGFNAVPFDWDTFLDYDDLDEQARDITLNLTGRNDLIQVDYNGEKYLVGQDSEGNATGFILDVNDRLGNVFEIPKIMDVELRTRHPKTFKSVEQIIDDAATANIVLEPWALTDKQVILYAMDGDSPVYASLPRNSVMELATKYGRSLEFRIHNEDDNREISRVSIVSDNNLVASVYPNKETISYGTTCGIRYGEDKGMSASIWKQYVDYSKICYVVSLMKQS